MTRRSMRVMRPVTLKVWPSMEQILEALTLHLPLLLTGGDMAKWWGGEGEGGEQVHVEWYVERRDAQEAEFARYLTT